MYKAGTLSLYANGQSEIIPTYVIFKEGVHGDDSMDEEEERVHGETGSNK